MSKNNNDNKAKNIDMILNSQITLSMKYSEIKGVTDEYTENRHLYEDKYKMYKYRAEISGCKNNKEYLSEKPIIKEDITGKNLYSNIEKAKEVYGNEYTKYIPQVDHSISLSEGHKILKLNPYLNDEDVRNILNDKSNFSMINANLNQKKSNNNGINFAISNKEMKFNERAKMVDQTIKSGSKILVNTTIVTTKNISKEFIEGSTNSIRGAIVPLIAKSVNNLVLVSRGDINLDEAKKDLTKSVVKISVGGGAIQVASTGLVNTIKLAPNVVSNLIAVSTIVSKSAIKYINGEIDEDKFVEEIMDNGVGLVSSIIGSMYSTSLLSTLGISSAACGCVVPFVGAMIATTVCSEVYKECKQIYKEYKELDKFKVKLFKINNIADEALKEIENQRNELKGIIENYFLKWDENINLGFEYIYNSTMNNDVEGIANGLDKILSTFNENVKFKNHNEFDNFLMDNDSVLEL